VSKLLLHLSFGAVARTGTRPARYNTLRRLSPRPRRPFLPFIIRSAALCASSKASFFLRPPRFRPSSSAPHLLPYICSSATFVDVVPDSALFGLFFQSACPGSAPLHFQLLKSLFCEALEFSASFFGFPPLRPCKTAPLLCFIFRQASLFSLCFFQLLRAESSRRKPGISVPPPRPFVSASNASNPRVATSQIFASINTPGYFGDPRNRHRTLSRCANSAAAFFHPNRPGRWAFVWQEPVGDIALR